MDVIRCESEFNPNAVGDNGTSYGLAQIHLPAHPSVSKEEALDPKFAVGWMVQAFKEGKGSMWTCYRKLYM